MLKYLTMMRIKKIDRQQIALATLEKSCRNIQSDGQGFKISEINELFSSLSNIMTELVESRSIFVSLSPHSLINILGSHLIRAQWDNDVRKRLIKVYCLEVDISWFIS